jgi:hypothetical protein
MCEDLFEDAYDHLVGKDELHAAVDAFNKKQTMSIWHEIPKKLVRVTR